MRTSKVVALSILLSMASFAFGQEKRDETIDCIILLDKSHSMGPKIEKAKAFLEKEIMPLFIFGDNITILTFYGKVDPLFSRSIRSKEDLTAALRAISSVKANGDWTDIGNALDELKKTLSGLEKDGKRKYILMVTDEKQEPPKGSRYPTQESVAGHFFLTYVKKTDFGDFRSIVIGIDIDEKLKEGLPMVMEALESIPDTRGELPSTETEAKAYEAKKLAEEAEAEAAAAARGEGGFPYFLVAGGILIIGFLIFLILFLRARASKKEEKPKVPLV